MGTARWLLPVGVMALVLAVMPARAASSVTYLGKPTNDVPEYVPLGGFIHRGPKLRSYGFPELLFIGSQNDGRSAAERWAVIKALDQFGSLSAVSAATTTPCRDTSYPYDPCIYPLPTFNWAHAHYRSRYVQFVHRDLLDQRNDPYQRLAPAESRLFRRYAASPGGTYRQTLLSTAFAVTNDQTPSRHFPLISIDGYLQTANDLLLPSDFVNTTPAPGCRTLSCGVLSFSAVRTALVRNTRTPGTTGTLVPDVNTESNILVTLICHADGSRPKSVCGRKPVQKLLRHVR